MTKTNTKKSASTIDPPRWVVEKYLQTANLSYVRMDSTLLVFYGGRYCSFTIYMAQPQDEGALLSIGDVAIIHQHKKQRDKQMLLLNELNSVRGRVVYFTEQFDKVTAVLASLRVSWLEVDNEKLFMRLLHGYAAEVEQAIYKFQMLGSVTRDGEECSVQEAFDDSIPPLFGRV